MNIVSILIVVGIFIAVLFASRTQPLLATTACDAISIVMVIGVLALGIAKKQIYGYGILGIIGLLLLTTYLHMHYHIRFLGGKHFEKVILFVVLIIVLSGVSILMNRNLPRR